jgi:hypothetical protein
MFGSKGEKVMRVIKSKMLRWVECVRHMGQMRNAYIILAGNMNRRDYSGDPHVDERIIVR